MISSWMTFIVTGGAVFLAATVVCTVFLRGQTSNYYSFQLFALVMVAGCFRLLTLPDVAYAGQAPRPKYAKSRLSENECRACERRLVAVMAQQEIYRRDNLRLSDVAEAVGASEHVVSQVINSRLGKSFSDFVNSHRVEAAKALLEDPDFAGYTIEAIGGEAGFSSRATFYSVFKRFTDTTPTEYRHSVRR